jgi:hypothetical protein
VPAAAALVLALLRIRDRYAARYVALLASVAIAAGCIRAADLSFPEAFHFIEYGLLAFLFYRVWRPLDDGALLLLPVLAGRLPARSTSGSSGSFPFAPARRATSA